MPEKNRFLKGQLLLDSGQLRGSFFQRTVVLICQHDAEGAFGLVLNRATGSKVGEMVVADLPEASKRARSISGGPVQPSALSFLHSDSFIPDANVIPNLSLGHSLDELVGARRIPVSHPQDQAVRRLRRLESGPARGRDETQGLAHTPRLAGVGLRHRPATSSGRTILRRKGWKYKLLAQMPEDSVIELSGLEGLRHVAAATAARGGRSLCLTCRS